MTTRPSTLLGSNSACSRRRRCEGCLMSRYVRTYFPRQGSTSAGASSWGLLPAGSHSTQARGPSSLFLLGELVHVQRAAIDRPRARTDTLFTSSTCARLCIESTRQICTLWCLVQTFVPYPNKAACCGTHVQVVNVGPFEEGSVQKPMIYGPLDAKMVLCAAARCSPTSSAECLGCHTAKHTLRAVPRFFFFFLAWTCPCCLTLSCGFLSPFAVCRGSPTRCRCAIPAACV